MPGGHVSKNRRYWDAEADEYQRRHGATLSRTALAWGPWRIPEADLKVLGDVGGKDVLELGCGGAQWSAALAGLGARPVGLDLSGRQLAHARGEMAKARTRFPLVQASGEDLPFADEAFDVVFCDHGAMNFVDPGRAVPEVARVLRPGGLFAFSHESSLRFLCWDPKTELVGRALHWSYFEMRSQEDEQAAVFQLPYGEWLRLFRAAGLAVEDLIEPRPGPGATTTYPDWDLEWCRRWPGESIWRVRKPAARDLPDLVGVTEAARILGWDKRRVATYIRRGSFPEPVAALASGRIWTREAVEAFARRFREGLARRRSRRTRPSGTGRAAPD